MSERMTAHEAADKIIALFDEYREAFGLCDHDFPDGGFPQKACDFEQKFCELICEFRGHNIGPDQCMKPEHDYCYRCGKLKSDIKSTP